jgi:aryl-alcohol dehydrogenase-like predicted oxidoreductase
MGLEYVDIFYAHRPWKNCPLEETMGALATAVHQGKALYVGISSYSPERTREAAKILKSNGRSPAHSSAVVLHAESLDRRKACSPRSMNSASAASPFRRWRRAC